MRKSQNRWSQKKKKTGAKRNTENSRTRDNLRRKKEGKKKMVLGVKREANNAWVEKEGKTWENRKNTTGRKGERNGFKAATPPPNTWLGLYLKGTKRQEKDGTTWKGILTASRKGKRVRFKTGKSALKHVCGTKEPERTLCT